MESEGEKLNVRDLALRRISVREYAASELRSYLVRKGATPEEAIQVVAELVADQRVDDRRYARVIARHQAFRDKGPAYVRAKLMQKGVRLSMREVQELYEEALPEAHDSELDMARKVIERRYPEALNDRDEARKAYQALMRRGFSRDVISKCLFRSRSSEDVD